MDQNVVDAVLYHKDRIKTAARTLAVIVLQLIQQMQNVHLLVVLVILHHKWPQLNSQFCSIAKGVDQ